MAESHLQLERETSPMDSIQVLKPGLRALSASGAVLSGGVYEFYDAGTTTPRTVYADKDLSIALGVTVTCDSGGYPTSDGSAKVEVYTGATPYKVILKAADATTIFSHDNVKGALDTSGFLTSGELTPQTPILNVAVDQSPTSSDAAAYYNVNCSGGAVTITLDLATNLPDGWYIKARHDGTANSVVIVASGSDVLKIGSHAGVTSFALTSRGQVATITCDGSGFKVEESSPALFNTTGVIAIVDRLSSPPGSSSPGQRFIATESPSGDWTSFAEHDIIEKGNVGWFKITPPTSCGWLAYVQDEDAPYQFIGSAWQAVYATNDEAAESSIANKAVTPANLDGYVPGCLLGILEQQNSAGTDESVSGSWATRPLNTEVYDRLGILSLSSNKFTISEAGTYEISWKSPHMGGGRTRLYNTTGSAVVAYATQGRWTGGTGNTMIYSDGVALVTISESTQLEIQNQGGGGVYSANYSTPEIYTRVVIRRG